MPEKEESPSKETAPEAPILKGSQRLRQQEAENIRQEYVKRTGPHSFAPGPHSPAPVTPGGVITSAAASPYGINSTV